MKKSLSSNVLYVMYSCMYIFSQDILIAWKCLCCSVQRYVYGTYIYIQIHILECKNSSVTTHNISGYQIPQLKQTLETQWRWRRCWWCPNKPANSLWLFNRQCTLASLCACLCAVYVYRFVCVYCLRVCVFVCVVWVCFQSGAHL